MRDDAGWQNGALPRSGFFAESTSDGRGYHRAAESAGLGSHRDNWLIRRFIALESLDDAQREYERVWQNYRTATEPFVLESLDWSGGSPRAGQAESEKLKLKRELHRPDGFSMAAMRFAMDYSQFLIRNNDPARAKELLLEVVLKLDMDRSPSVFAPGRPLRFDEGRDWRVVRDPYGTGRFVQQVGLSRGDFLRRTLGLFRTLQAEPELIAAIDAKIKAGDNRLRRVLARIRLIQAQPEPALTLELAYLDNSKLDEASITVRKATLFDEANKSREAITAAERDRKSVV